ncbi:hypothetical protein ACFQRB_01540 [Halobaculum litoreum]|uniref:Uncharacterized protein n=1 Tax=Halobaculum litoreum TaxID=3031998 RepID=A0ABD5XU31_9EURY
MEPPSPVRWRTRRKISADSTSRRNATAPLSASPRWRYVLYTNTGACWARTDPPAGR